MEAHDCNFRPDLGMGCINGRCPLHRAMRRLGDNLAIAGVLCHSHRLGRVDRHTEIWQGKQSRQRWFPGCGRSVL